MKPTSTHVYQIGLQVTNWVTFKSWAFKMNPIWQSCKDAHNIQYGIKKWATNWKNILNISLINSKWMIIRIRKSFLIHAEWSLQHKAEIKDMLWNPDEGKSKKYIKICENMIICVRPITKEETGRQPLPENHLFRPVKIIWTNFSVQIFACGSSDLKPAFLKHSSSGFGYALKGHSI